MRGFGGGVSEEGREAHRSGTREDSSAVRLGVLPEDSGVKAGSVRLVDNFQITALRYGSG